MKILLLLIVVNLLATPLFVSQPQMAKNGESSYTITFTLNEYTDVAVAIINTKDSTIVRSLAAGVLGTNPPLPLQPNSLSQTLTWDGLDNFGRSPSVPDSLLKVRVRAGMKPRIVSFHGDDAYAMYSSFNGLCLNKNGKIIIASGMVPGITAGSYDDTQTQLREFDLNGIYVKTLFPPPANLPKSAVEPLGINALDNNEWSPCTWGLNFATLSKTLLTSQLVEIIPTSDTSEILLGSPNGFQTLRIDGTALPGDTIRKFIPAVSQYQNKGTTFLSPSANPKYLYLSGRYTGPTDNYSGTANDTGFWRDGQIWKVEKATGKLTPWIALDSVPTKDSLRKVLLGGSGWSGFSAIHGITIDDSGHVFVCDRLHKRISVYDTNAVLQHTIPANNPDEVILNKKSQELYVVTRTISTVTLNKYANWKTATTASYSVSIGTSSYPVANNPSVVVTESDGKPIIVVGQKKGNYGSAAIVSTFSDDGTKFTKLKTIVQENPNPPLVDFNRIAVDRRNENVYIQNGVNGLYKIENWSNPVVRVCSTSANKVLPADDMVIDEKRNLLYLHESVPYPGSHNGPITRYTLDHKHVPVPFENTGKNVVTPWYGNGGDVQGKPARGFDISPKTGKIIGINAFMYPPSPGIRHMELDMLPDTGSADTIKGINDTTGGKYSILINPLHCQSGGVKFDQDGNFYVGIKATSSTNTIPTGYLNDNGYKWGVGSVVKFAPDAKNITANGQNWYALSSTFANVTGHSKIYSQGFAPFGGSSTIYKGCMCRSPRFDVDYYGRLFIPNGVTKKIAVVDNNGNTIVEFGKYGNRDSRGGLPGPGEAISSPEFPLAYPVSAAASDEYIYIGDMINWRMMRVKMEYYLDNLPGYSPTTAAMQNDKGLSPVAELSASPNPFNPNSTIKFYTPAVTEIKLAVYDLKGALVCELFNGRAAAGNNSYSWNGRDSRGVKMASGLYVYKVASRNARVSKTVKTMLSK
ncbi:MAG: T9SS type A sorting domain-containing protein [Fibrobacteres bacterium]|nr:T9SS type A sorting domain-containing protein [Fibrobacterota bacterium]